jgi:hypothetical protein
MKSIRPDAAPAREHAIDSMRGPTGQPHEPARTRALVVRLDEQMKVVGLHGEMDDAKPSTCRFSERTPKLEEDHLLPKAWEKS